MDLKLKESQLMIKLFVIFLHLFSCESAPIQSVNSKTNHPDTSKHKMVAVDTLLDFGFGKNRMRKSIYDTLNNVFTYERFASKKMYIEELEQKYKSNNQFKFQVKKDSIIFNYDLDLNILKITIGKNYFESDLIKTVDDNFKNHFDIDKVYYIRFFNNEYLAIFHQFLIPNNSNLEKSILLFTSTDTSDWVDVVFPNLVLQISNSTLCFSDLNSDGLLDYIGFNPYSQKHCIELYLQIDNRFRKCNMNINTTMNTELGVYIMDENFNESLKKCTK